MHVETKSGSSQKGLNVDLNLVPFIDLMSMAISFLLITAVWTQVSMIQIGSSIYGKKTDSGEVVPPMKEVVNLRLNVVDNGYIITVGKVSSDIPKRGGNYDDMALVEFLKNVKQKYPEKTDGIVGLLDDIKYDELIKGMDALMTAGFPEISIATQ